MRRWFLVVLVVLAALLAAADFGARSVAQRELASRLHRRVPSASTASARIRSFPFLLKLLASGEVAEVDARVRDVDVEGLRFASIAVDLHGVRLDRGEFRAHRRVVIQDIDRGTVKAEVTQEALSDVFGIDVALENGRVSVSVAGRRISGELAVRNGRLTVAGVGIPLPALSLVAPLLPCVPSAQIATGRVLLTCAFDEIPDELKVVA